jgi:hypothetical protein
MWSHPRIPSSPTPISLTTIPAALSSDITHEHTAYRWFKLLTHTEPCVCSYEMAAHHPLRHTPQAAG